MYQLTKKPTGFIISFDVDDIVLKVSIDRDLNDPFYFNIICSMKTITTMGKVKA